MGVDLNAFEPSPERAQAVSARMRARLADSLRYIREEVEGRVPIPAAFDGFLARLAEAPVSPAVFGAYCDLVLALEDNALGEAERLLAEMSLAPNAPNGPAIIGLADPETDLVANRYRRLVDTDASMPMSIVAPPPERAAAVRALILEALKLIERGNPRLAGEIRELLREIVLAAEAGGPNASGFEGVSSFMLWGAAVLNVEMQKDALDMVQVLAHESGHNLLFGLCAHGPLHENGDDERFGSPLRRDARPIDGIVHAAYVSARMHYAVRSLADAGVFAPAQREEAGRANALNVKRFVMGMETVDRHARLTPLGREVMAGARRYMAPYLTS